MAESNPEKKAETASSPPASSPDELVKDLDGQLSEEEKDSVVGGRFGKVSLEYIPPKPPPPPKVL